MKRINKFLSHPGNQSTIKWGVCAAVFLTAMYFFQMYVLDDGVLNVITETEKLYCALIWIIFANLCSKLEAYYFAHEIMSKLVDNFNEHPLFNLIRLCVWIPLWIIAGWKVALLLGLMFPFFHDGSYYWWREKIAPGTYPKKYFAQSTTSTALSTRFMTPVVRTLLALGSFVTLYFI